MSFPSRRCPAAQHTCVSSPEAQGAPLSPTPTRGAHPPSPPPFRLLFVSGAPGHRGRGRPSPKAARRPADPRRRLAPSAVALCQYHGLIRLPPVSGLVSACDEQQGSPRDVHPMHVTIKPRGRIPLPRPLPPFLLFLGMRHDNQAANLN